MSNPYATADSAQDTLDRVNRRVTSDIRSQVRRIHPAPSDTDSLHSIETNPHWLNLTETYVQLSSLALSDERESFVNAESYVTSTILGVTAAPLQTSSSASMDGTDLGKAKDHSTIWERDEIVVRIIIEEGKPNLVARTMMDAWALYKDPRNEFVESNASARCMVIASGALLRSSMMALETLQTLDVRNVLSHAHSVFSSIQYNVPLPHNGDSLQLLLSQQGMVVSYMAHLVHKMEKLRTEDIIFEGIMESKIVSFMLQHAEWTYPLLAAPQYPELLTTLSKGKRTTDDLGPFLGPFAQSLAQDFPANYVIFFVALLDSEHGKAAWAQLFPDRASKKRFVEVMEPVTRLLMPGAMISAELRKSCRVLTDTILRFK